MTRDLFVLFTLGASVPLGIRFPWMVALAYGWLGFLLPERVLRGWAYGWTLGWIPVVAVFIGLWRSGMAHLPRSREVVLLLSFWAFCVVTTLAATRPDEAWAHFFEMSRNLALIFAVVVLTRGDDQLQRLVWATALSVGVYALGGALWVLASSASVPLDGPRGSNISNNNDLGAVLVAITPFFVFLARQAVSTRLRRLVSLLFTATIVATIGTFSRGAAVGLGVVLLFLCFAGEWQALRLAVVAAVVFALFGAPQKWLTRAATIAGFQEHTAAMRLPSWYVAACLGLDHPLLGAGFAPFAPDVYDRYIPGYPDHHDAHNLFLQVFAEHGFPGLLLYSGLIVSTFLTLRRVHRRSVTRTDVESRAWTGQAAVMIAIGFSGYIVDGMVQCLSYRALFFDFVGLAILLDGVTSGWPAQVDLRNESQSQV